MLPANQQAIGAHVTQIGRFLTPFGKVDLDRETRGDRARDLVLGSCSGRSRRPPILKRFASESAERIAGNEMALDVERVVDCGMNGQEPLC